MEGFYDQIIEDPEYQQMERNYDPNTMTRLQMDVVDTRAMISHREEEPYLFLPGGLLHRSGRAHTSYSDEGELRHDVQNLKSDFVRKWWTYQESRS